MALAENLRITHSVRDDVKVVDGKVESVEDKVKGVGKKVGEIGEKVEDVSDKMKFLDGKVQVVIDGSQAVTNHRLLIFLLSYFKRVVVTKDANLILQQTATSVNEVKSS